MVKNKIHWIKKLVKKSIDDAITKIPNGEAVNAKVDLDKLSKTLG